MEGKRLGAFIDKLFHLEKIPIKTIFESDSNFKYQQYFSARIDKKECEILPSFLAFK